MNIKIGIIVDCLLKGSASVTKYLKELLKFLCLKKPSDLDIVLLATKTSSRKARNRGSVLIDSVDLVGFRSKRVYEVLSVDKGLKFIDVLHVPDRGRSAPSLHLIRRAKRNGCSVIVTNHGLANMALPLTLVYDRLLLLHFLKDHTDLLMWHFTKTFIDIMIAPSMSERYVLNKALNLTDRRIVVIYHGVNHKHYRPRPRHECSKVLINNYGLVEDFILHVSSYQPKKNVERIIAAYALLKKKYNIKEELVIVGNQPKAKLLNLALSLGLNLKDIIFVGTVPEEHLPYFYSSARVFVFPSLHESFGMPILEAMACGCPVVTSNVFACPEVAGDAALLVDPFSVKDIAMAILRVLRDEELREKLVKKGLERARHFTWERSALQHIKVYRAVAKRC